MLDRLPGALNQEQQLVRNSLVQGIIKRGKKVKMKFLRGIPINLEGDFNGDGKKDLLIIDEGTMKIFPLISLNKGFSKRPEFIIKTQHLNSYIVQDMNNNNKSDVIVFSGNEIKFILF